MNRRSLLRGLFFLPLAPLAAKLVPESVSEWLLRWPERHRPKTLLDFVRRSQKAKMDALLPVIESLSRQNKLLEDTVWTEGNLETGHHVTMGTPYPEVTFRRLGLESTHFYETTTRHADQYSINIFSWAEGTKSGEEP